jgi:hypothetical protein
MMEHRPPTDPTKVAAGRDGARGRFFLGLAMLTLIRAGEALAADQAAAAGPSIKRDLEPPTPLYARPFAAQPLLSTPLSTPLSQVPREYALPPLAEPHELTDVRTFSSKDFRARGHSVFEADPVIGSANDNLMTDRTVWQRLQEYRTRDRVRVLTLWESGASAVSIQTDRKGDPSLQWTSRLMNRGGATRGLLDRWMPATVFRSFTRSAGPSAGKTPGPAALPHAGVSAIP